LGNKGFGCCFSLYRICLHLLLLVFQRRILGHGVRG
jgi:hypothetical protein